MLLVYDTVNYTPKVEINIIVPDVSRAAGYHAVGSGLEAGDSKCGTSAMMADGSCAGVGVDVWVCGNRYQVVFDLAGAE